MKSVLVRITTLTLFVSLLGGAAGLAGPAARAGTALIDPALASASGLVSVIVTAADSAAAARAVAGLGGQVTSDLWLIDAVAARLPAGQIQALAASPGVQSVVANNPVKTAGDWSGWVTDLRILKASIALGTAIDNPAAFLPDGAIVAVSQGGVALIVNPNGTERVRVNLQGSPYTSAPAIGADGTIYIAGQTQRIFALNPDGSIRWQYAPTGAGKFFGGVALGSDGTVYAADDGRNIYAVNGATGQLLWKYKVGSSGAVLTNPVLGPDNSLYITTDKGYVYAVSPNGTTKWSYNTATTLKLQPVVANGRVYVAADTKKLFGLDAASGARLFTFTTPGSIRANPAVDAAGNLYLPTEPGLYSLTAAGAQRFYFAASGGQFKTSPVLAPDGQTVYAAVAGKNLFAIDTASGAQKWMYLMAGNMSASPAVDAGGNIIAGDDASNLVRVTPQGGLASKHKLAGAISQSASTHPSGQFTARAGTSTLAVLGRLPETWDGRPDVQPTSNKNVWKMVNPVTVDIGADVLHNTPVTASRNNKGAGVTVAVVDSGIYFSSETISQLSGQINQQFLGQIDFVEPACPAKSDGTLAGIQYPDHCQVVDKLYSRDSYGHGTHVAGTIWNNLTDETTGAYMGVAPDANILSVRVLNGDGAGTYETVIKGIQYVVDHKQYTWQNQTNTIRVMNLSLSAYATVPYFVDPLNRAVEQAWANGIVVLAAAGNSGPAAETVTVPGSDPYVITVGAVNESRTAGFWTDDTLPSWSAAGPTLDGFVKPDVLAPGSQIISFMYNDPTGANTQKIVQLHPDYSATASLFRMNGTSMATAVASGVVALMLQANPGLTPDQVKFRLMYSAIPSFAGENDPTHNLFQQGAGRIWAPDAVFGSFPADGNGNLGLDIAADLAHGYDTDEDLAFHYQGTIAKMLSDDGQYYIYYVDDADGTRITLGVARVSDMTWLDADTLPEGAAWDSGQMTWAGGRMSWAGGRMSWAGGRMSWAGGRMSWAGGRMSWAGGRMSWAGGRMSWAGGRMSWAGGRMSWAGTTDAYGSGRMSWAGMTDAYAGGRMSWAGSVSPSSNTGATTWIGDW